MTETPVFTRAEYDRLPEGFPAELIEGELVREPAPFYQHQRVVAFLMSAISRQVGNDRIVCSPIDVVLDDRNVLQPDVAVFREALPAGLLRVPVPALVIEVLSESTAHRDRVRKPRIYLDHGVEEVWLVHPFTGTIEVCTREGRVMHAADTHVTSTALSDVSLRGSELIL